MKEKGYYLVGNYRPLKIQQKCRGANSNFYTLIQALHL